MRPRAPGWRWLLAHELRLSWRSGKANAIRIAILVGIFWLILHAAGWFLMRSPQKLVQGQAIIATGAATWFVLLLAVATAFGLSVVALFSRGDLDLLLSSPIPPRTVFAVRGLGVALQSIGMVAVFCLPFANAAVLHGNWRMLAAYPVLMAAGLGTTAIAFAATLALVRAFGVRRAKVIAQVLGAIAGAIFFLSSQASGMVPTDRMKEIIGWLHSDAAQPWIGTGSPLWLPARAIFGDPVAAVVFVALGSGLFVAVIHLFERRFLEGTRESEAPSHVRRTRAASRSRGFRSGLAAIVVMKELKLLWRDPRLISQTLLQMLYLVPLVFLGIRHGLVGHFLAPVVLLIGTTLAGNLGFMTVSGEEAPDLVSSAPVRMQSVFWLKVAAALVAPIVLIVPFVVLHALESLAAGAIFTLCAVGALTGSAVVQVWNARPGSARDLKKRMQSGKFAGFVELVGAVGWAGACYALLHGSAWGVIGIAVGLAAPAGAWMMRPDPLAEAA